jgi:uracil-DNA glycosylase family 4
LRRSPGSRELERLNAEVTACRRCARLVEWREEVARTKRAAYAEEEYWGRPVPSFGDPEARILIVGLAPGAHGANRTGRMFTGDRSGEWLYGALHRAGLSSRPDSTRRDDGLELRNAWLTAAVRCVPPANKPTPAEREVCRPFLEREILAFADLRVVVALGGFSWGAILLALRDLGFAVPAPRPKFGHGAEVEIAGSANPPGAGEAPRSPGDLVMIGSYHPSQQNTFTGRLTREMFDAVWTRAVEIAG